MGDKDISEADAEAVRGILGDVDPSNHSAWSLSDTPMSLGQAIERLQRIERECREGYSLGTSDDGEAIRVVLDRIASPERSETSPGSIQAEQIALRVQRDQLLQAALLLMVRLDHPCSTELVDQARGEMRHAINCADDRDLPDKIANAVSVVDSTAERDRLRVIIEKALGAIFAESPGPILWDDLESLEDRLVLSIEGLRIMALAERQHALSAQADRANLLNALITEFSESLVKFAAGVPGRTEWGFPKLIYHVVASRDRAEELILAAASNLAAVSGSESSLIEDPSEGVFTDETLPSPGPVEATNPDSYAEDEICRTQVHVVSPPGPVHDIEPDFANAEAIYRDRLRYWLRTGEGGRWVAIRDNQVVGIGETQEEAEQIGRDRCGSVPVLVKRIEEPGLVKAVLRDLGGCGG